MAIISYSDNFNRPNGPLGATSTGFKPWRVDSGMGLVDSGMAWVDGVATTDAETPEVDVSATIRDNGCLVFRAVDAANYWRLRLAVGSTGDRLFLERVVGGSLTIVGQWRVVANLGRGTARAINRSDGLIGVLFNGTSLLTTSSTTLATATRVGLGGRAYADDFVVSVLVQPPSAPTGLAPNGAASVDRTQPIRFAWTPANQGQTQTAFRLRYRQVGASVWRVIDQAGTGREYTLAAGTLPVGTFEWEVSTTTAVGTGPYSARASFSTATPPGAPVLTSPAAGGTVTNAQHATKWTVDAQDSYQLRIYGPDGVTVLFDSGEVVSTTRTRITYHFTNGRSEFVALRVKAGGLWSGWARNQYTVLYTPPPTPTHVLGVDGPWLKVLPTAPPPSGSEPAVSHLDVYRRPKGSRDGEGLRVATGVQSGEVWLDPHVAHLEDVEYRVLAYGTNGAVKSGAWSDALSVPVDVTQDSTADQWVTGADAWDSGTTDWTITTATYRSTYGTTY